MNHTIMIVDDEPMITSTLSALVRLTMKQAVAVYNDPREALKAQALHNGSIDLILSDFLMPGMNGVEFLKRAREISPHAIAVMLTGYADKENAIRSINEVGLYYYIEKPWDNTSLIQILQNGLEKKELTENLKKQVIALQDSKNAIERLYSMVQQEYTDELSQSREMIISLANVIEAKDHYTDGHTRRVGALCRLVGSELGLSADRIANLSVAAGVHDIGKVGIPENILNKPGKLTEEEYEFMKQHPVLGETILMPLGSMRACLDPVRHHHEKLNGTGYPDGLSNDEISLEARILAVVDIFDALNSTRPYRVKMPLIKTRTILNEECEKGELDKQVLDALFTVLDSGLADGINE